MKYIVLFYLLNSFSLNCFAQKDTLVQNDSLKFFVKKFGSKSSYIPIKDLFSRPLLSNGTYFTDSYHGKIKNVGFFYGNLKPTFLKVNETMPLFRKARLFSYSSHVVYSSQFIFLFSMLNNEVQIANGKRMYHPKTNFNKKYDYRTRMYFRAYVSSIIIGTITARISRNFLDKAAKKYNRKIYSY